MSSNTQDVPEGYILVHKKRTIYLHSIKDYRPVTPYLKKLTNAKKKQPTSIRRRTSSKKSNKQEESDAERSIRKTKKLVRDYALSNTFDLFITFTFKSNRYDLEGCKQRIRNWLKNEKKRKGSFEYLVVPERHKDGAFHFHGLLKNYSGNMTIGDSSKARREEIYNIDSYTLGFTTAKKIDQNPESYGKVANYMTKYITKDMPRMSGKNRYLVSHGLKKPVEIDNPEPLTQSSYYQHGVENGIYSHYRHLEDSND